VPKDSSCRYVDPVDGNRYRDCPAEHSGSHRAEWNHLRRIPGVNAPPSSLGPYAMAGFGTDPQPLGTDVAGVDDASTGADIGFSPSLVHLRVAQGGPHGATTTRETFTRPTRRPVQRSHCRQARTDSISMLSRIFSRPSPSLRRHRTAHPPGHICTRNAGASYLASIRTGTSR